MFVQCSLSVVLFAGADLGFGKGVHHRIWDEGPPVGSRGKAPVGASGTGSLEASDFLQIILE